MRYAVYFAPEAAHPLWHAGCSWLGRDPLLDDDDGAAAPPARADVASPWRYGFHATLKPPFRLREGTTEAAWLAAVNDLAAQHAAFDMPPLRVDKLNRFLALVPAEELAPTHPLRRLADDTVLRLDAWRAPHTPAERDRYLRGIHLSRQVEQVERLGYAHVLDDWRFHMTLSNVLDALDDAGRAAAMRAEAEAHFASALAQPLRCESLAVYVEAEPGRPFRLAHRCALGAG